MALIMIFVLVCIHQCHPAAAVTPEAQLWVCSLDAAHVSRHVLFRAGRHISSTHACCFDCKRNVSRCRCSYSIWVTFGRRLKISNVGGKLEFGIKTRSVKSTKFMLKQVSLQHLSLCLLATSYKGTVCFQLVLDPTASSVGLVL